MKKAFELIPLLAAAALGALLWTVFNSSNNQNSTSNSLLYGALTGMGVQIGVRLLGVS